jgi:hypothetical protein
MAGRVKSPGWISHVRESHVSVRAQRLLTHVKSKRHVRVFVWARAQRLCQRLFSVSPGRVSSEVPAGSCRPTPKTWPPCRDATTWPITAISRSFWGNSSAHDQSVSAVMLERHCGVLKLQVCKPKEAMMGAIMVGTCASDWAGNINARLHGQIGRIWQ